MKNDLGLRSKVLGLRSRPSMECISKFVEIISNLFGLYDCLEKQYLVNEK